MMSNSSLPNLTPPWYRRAGYVKLWLAIGFFSFIPWWIYLSMTATEPEIPLRLFPIRALVWSPLLLIILTGKIYNSEPNKEGQWVRWDTGWQGLVVFFLLLGVREIWDYVRPKPSYDPQSFQMTSPSPVSPVSGSLAAKVAASADAMTLFEQGKFAEAIAKYNRAIELNPLDATLFYRRGLAYERNQNDPAALIDYDRAIELDPKHAAAYCNRGTILVAQNDLINAEIDLSKCLSMEPDSFDARVALAIIFQRQKKYLESVEEWSEVIRLRPTFAEGYAQRGRLLLLLEKFLEASFDLDRAIELHQNHFDALELRMFLRQKAGNEAGAARDLEQMRRLNPEATKKRYGQ
jgi:tetratricopeptide (TPR) repeat protein